MKGTWLRILGLLLFVGVIAVGGGWWMMRGQGGDSLPALKEAAPAPVQSAQEKGPSAEKTLLAPASNELVVPGVIEPYETVPISAKQTANITSLLVRDGSSVKKGQLLCTLDDIDIRQRIDSARLAVLQAEEALRSARERMGTEGERQRLALARAQEDLDSFHADSKLQLARAQAALTRAEKELSDAEALFTAKAVSADEVRLKREAVEEARRSLELTRSSIAAGRASREKTLAQVKLDTRLPAITEQEVEARRLALDNARTELEKSRRQQADSRIIAPVSGTVSVIPRTRNSAMTTTGSAEEKLGPGVRVFEGDPFMEIATTERGCIKIEVDETDIGRIHVGMPAKITGDAFPGRELKGEVLTIQTSGRRAGEGVSLFPVTIAIVSPLQGVKMGMTADVTLELMKATERGNTDER